MINLTKEEWKQLEKQYPKESKVIFRPPVWLVEEELMSLAQYELTLNEIALIEAEKSNMQYSGTSINVDDDTYVEYYISKDNKLYQFLYKEQLKYIYHDNDDLVVDIEECDIVHTENYICECICISENEVQVGSA